jgi:hypothetical protein
MRLAIKPHVVREYRAMIAGLLAAAFLVSSADVEPGLQKRTPAAFARVGALQGDAMRETSGLAASRRHPGLFWALNDSGDEARLFALDSSGRQLGEVHIDGARNLDWEDLAAWRDEQGQPWLAIADIGDNFAWRQTVQLYLLAEPEPGARRATVARSIEFRWSDGPHDSESLAVDASGRQFLFVDKARVPMGLYRLPIDAPPRGAVAQRIADLPLIEPRAAPSTTARLRRSSAVAMDISDDGRRLMILTYAWTALFERDDGENWATVMQRPPRGTGRVPSGLLFEAAALAPDGRSAWIASEGAGTPIYQWLRIERRAPKRAR